MNEYQRIVSTYCKLIAVTSESDVAFAKATEITNNQLKTIKLYWKVAFNMQKWAYGPMKHSDCWKSSFTQKSIEAHRNQRVINLTICEIFDMKYRRNL